MKATFNKSCLPPLMVGAVRVSTEGGNLHFEQNRLQHTIPATAVEQGVTTVDAELLTNILNKPECGDSVTIESSDRGLFVASSGFRSGTGRTNPMSVLDCGFGMPHFALDAAQLQEISGAMLQFVSEAVRPDIRGVNVKLSGDSLRFRGGNDYMMVDYVVGVGVSVGVDYEATITLSDFTFLLRQTSEMYTFEFKQDGTVLIVYNLGLSSFKTAKFNHEYGVQRVFVENGDWASIPIDYLLHGLPGQHSKLSLAPGMPLNIRNQKGTEIINAPCDYRGERRKVGFNAERLEKCLQPLKDCESIRIHVSGPEDPILLNSGQLTVALMPERQKWTY